MQEEQTTTANTICELCSGSETTEVCNSDTVNSENFAMFLFSRSFVKLNPSQN